MSELKCWKPKRKINKENILEMEHTRKNAVLWINQGVPNYVSYAEFEGGAWSDGFTKRLKSKSRAIIFAQKYMKDHDRC